MTPDGPQRKITRVEVIDENGRSYVNWSEDNVVECSLQDEGRTLKVFVNKKPKVEAPSTLLDMLRRFPSINQELGQDLVDAVERWLPKPQSAAGSQNGYVECTVDGFNDCLTKIKNTLR